MRTVKETVLTLAKEHYRRILMETELLLQYVHIYSFPNLERAIEDILETIEKIDEELYGEERHD
jgi:hypothetical protein